MQDAIEVDGDTRQHALTTALIGAAAGAVGTAALDSIDWWMWDREDPAARRRTEQVRPRGEPPADVLVGRIEDATGTGVDQESHQKRGVAMHYAIGIAPAVGYALFRDRLPVRGVARGALYGFGLWLMQDEVTNTVTGLGAKPQDYPWQAHARGLVAHVAYGVTTELALDAAEQLLDRG